MAGKALNGVDGIESLITATQAAELCGVTTQCISNWVARGILTQAGLDERGRKVYKLIDVAKAERATRDHPAARSRCA
jgi:hypothetical protein